MNKIFLIILIIVVLLAVNIVLLVGLTDYYDRQAYAPLTKPPDHGTTFIVEADFSQMPGDTNMALLEKVLQKRLAGMGTHAFMEPGSASQLRMMLPVADSNMVEQIRNNITRRGFLELRLVNDRSDEIIANHWPIPPDYEVMQSIEVGPGQQTPSRFVVKKTAENGLAGDFVETARVVENSFGEPQISFTMKPDGARRFAELTTQYSPDRQTGQKHFVAIILDSELYSAPFIKDPIVDGECEIDGSFSEEEAQRMTLLLNDPLPAPIKIVDTKSF
jgi:preprotein translocase subunit SecD